MFDINQFRSDILTPSLECLQFREPELRELLVFTCAVESNGGTYFTNKRGCFGIYALHPNDFTDLWFNYVLRKPDIVNLLSLNVGIHRIPEPYQIISDLKLATILCALFYKFKKAFIVSTKSEDLWNAYKEFYDTNNLAIKDKSIAIYSKFVGEKPVKDKAS